MLIYAKTILFTLFILMAVPFIVAAQSANRVYFYEDIDYKGAVVSFNGIRDVPDL